MPDLKGPPEDPLNERARKVIGIVNRYIRAILEDDQAAADLAATEWDRLDGK